MCHVHLPSAKQLKENCFNYILYVIIIAPTKTHIWVFTVHCGHCHILSNTIFDLLWCQQLLILVIQYTTKYKSFRNCDRNSFFIAWHDHVFNTFLITYSGHRTHVFLYLTDFKDLGQGNKKKVKYGKVKKKKIKLTLPFNGMS